LKTIFSPTHMNCFARAEKKHPLNADIWDWRFIWCNHIENIWACRLGDGTYLLDFSDYHCKPSMISVAKKTVCKFSWTYWQVFWARVRVKAALWMGSI